jgi:hypothetical protein
MAGQSKFACRNIWKPYSHGVKSFLANCGARRANIDSILVGLEN